MFDALCIPLSGSFIDAERRQELDHDPMAFPRFLRQIRTGVGQED